MPINSAEQVLLGCMLHSRKGIGKGREARPLSQSRWEKVDQKTAAAVLERCQQLEPSPPETSLGIPGFIKCLPPITICLYYHAETQWSQEKTPCLHIICHKWVLVE